MEDILRRLLRPNLTNPLDERIAKPERRSSTKFRIDAPYEEHRLKTYPSPEKWEQEKISIRQAVLIASGLIPEPEKCSLNAKIFDAVDCGDFVIEKFMFESIKDFFVTGNIYSPKNKNDKLPVILCPHGHWPEGRFTMREDNNVPMRCINFARMGCIAISYDMIGYCDSCQIAHYFSGLDKELWGISAFGIQTWNSIRVLDFAFEYLNINKDYVGITGASGGATQTLILSAIDDRITLSAPVCMVSADYQGGCYCENAAHLKIDYTNIDFASMFAPKPQMLVGCTGDWTKNLAGIEYPAVKKIYDMYNAGQNIEFFMGDCGHNYNSESRHAVADFFSRKIFGVPFAGEQPYDMGDVKRFRIYPEAAPQKDRSVPLNPDFSNELALRLKHEKKLTADKIRLCNPELLRNEYYRITGAYKALGGCELQDRGETFIGTFSGVENTYEKFYLKTSAGGNIPSVLIKKTGTEPDSCIIFISGNGKKALEQHWEELSPLLENSSILALDLFLTGEMRHPYFAGGRHNEEVIQFTAFNFTDDQWRIADLIDVSGYAQSNISKKISIYAYDKSAFWAAAASPFLKGINEIRLCPENYKLCCDNDYEDYFFIPHFLAYGGFNTAIALADNTNTQISFYLNGKDEKYYQCCDLYNSISQ